MDPRAIEQMQKYINFLWLNDANEVYECRHCSTDDYIFAQASDHEVVVQHLVKHVEKYHANEVALEPEPVTDQEIDEAVASIRTLVTDPPTRNFRTHP